MNSRDARGFGWAAAVVTALALCGGVAGCGGNECPSPGILLAGGECVRPCTPDASSYCHADGAVSTGHCGDAQTACEGRCTSIEDDPEHCGGCGQRCPAVEGSQATCTRGVCGIACNPGRLTCGNSCPAPGSALSCESPCTPCAAPSGATPTCNANQCGWECSAGYDSTGERCEVPVPRPMAPLSTATVTSQRPTLRWEQVPGTDGAAIEICRDRAFTVQCQMVEADGTSARPASALSPGVWFWRLRGRSQGRVGTHTSAVWQFSVGARSAPVDTSYGTVLDVNGDGVADLAVGTVHAERVHVYLGSATGLSATPALSLTGPDGDHAWFGQSVAAAGDVNGDGYADLAVGASNTMDRIGRVHLYLGSATGLSTTPALSLTGPDGEEGKFGVSVAGAGDVNGDGYADLAVGASHVMNETGRVHLYLGSATGLSATPAQSLTGPDGDRGVFGGTVAGAGDVNGDGYADLAVSAYGAMQYKGRVHVYLGSATGLRPTPTRSFTGTEGEHGSFGRSLAGAGDLNGDGYADLAVAAPIEMNSTGRVQVYFGSATGLSPTPARRLTAPEGYHPLFGASVTSAGDLDGDGYADLVVGAEGAGRAYVYPGSAAGTSTTPAHRLTGPDGEHGIFGAVVTGAGDHNGDGYADLTVADPGAMNGTGRVHVHPGSATGPSTMPAQSLTGPDGTLIYFGISLARADAPHRAPRPAPPAAPRTRERALVCAVPPPV